MAWLIGLGLHGKVLVAGWGCYGGGFGEKLPETFPVSHGRYQHFQEGPSKAEAISNRGSVSESPTLI